MLQNSFLLFIYTTFTLKNPQQNCTLASTDQTKIKMTFCNTITGEMQSFIFFF